MMRSRSSLTVLALCLSVLLCTISAENWIVLNKCAYFTASNTKEAIFAAFANAKKASGASYWTCLDKLAAARKSSAPADIAAHKQAMDKARDDSARVKEVASKLLNSPRARNLLRAADPWQIHGFWPDEGPVDTCYSDYTQPAYSPPVTSDDFAFADYKKRGAFSSGEIRSRLSDLTKAEITLDFPKSLSVTISGLKIPSEPNLFTSCPNDWKPNTLVFDEWLKHGRYLPSNVALASGKKLMKFTSPGAIAETIAGPIRDYAALALSFYADSAPLCDRALKLTKLPIGSSDAIHFKGSGDCRVRVLLDSATGKYTVDKAGAEDLLSKLEVAEKNPQPTGSTTGSATGSTPPPPTTATEATKVADKDAQSPQPTESTPPPPPTTPTAPITEAPKPVETGAQSPKPVATPLLPPLTTPVTTPITSPVTQAPTSVVSNTQTPQPQTPQPTTTSTSTSVSTSSPSEAEKWKQPEPLTVAEAKAERAGEPKIEHSVKKQKFGPQFLALSSRYRSSEGVLAPSAF